MDESMLNTLWETLEQLAVTIEAPGVDREQMAVALQGCLEQVLRYQPALLVAKAEQSALATRPLVSWLVYEAQRLGDTVAAQGLRQLWQSTRQADEGPLIAPPSRAMI